MGILIRAARVSVESKVLPLPEAPPARPPPPAGPPSAVTPNTTPNGVVEPAPRPIPARLMAEELEALRRQAIENGREQGLQQGLVAGKQEWLRQTELLHAAVEALRAAQLRALGDLTHSATEIVLVAVAKILGDAFITPDAALAAVQEAVRRCHDRSSLQVHVAPADFEVLSAHHQDLLERTRAGELELVADERVALGGCIVESAAGSLDARLEVQVTRLHETLRNARVGWVALAGSHASEAPESPP